MVLSSFRPTGENSSTTNAPDFEIQVQEHSYPALIMLLGESRFLGKIWRFDHSSLLIGRASHCDIDLEDSRIDKTQALIAHRNNKILIEDLSSRDGTYLNGLKMERGVPTEIHPGDHIEMGVTVFMYIEAKGSEASLLENLGSDPGIDRLTGWALFEERSEPVNDWIKDSQLFYLTLVNIDDLKSINENYGSAAGDYVVNRVSRLLCNQDSTDRLYFRLNNNELAILAKDLSPQLVRDHARSLVDEVCRHKLSIGSRIIELSISCGIGVLDGVLFNWSDLYDQSFAALYEAKHLGKGTCQLSHNLDRMILK